MKKFRKSVYCILLITASSFLGAHAWAVDYTVSDEASCLSFAAGIGTTADWSFTDTCVVIGGTLPATDSVTFTGIAAFRPQTDPFTNFGTITIDSSIEGYYGAALFTNQGSFTIAATEQPQNYSQIVNEGTFSTEIALYNGGTITNTCGATIEGDILNNPVIQEECEVSVSKTTATTSETGTSDSVSYVLDAEPAADVTLTVSAGDTSEGLLSDADETGQGSVTLTFTAANWDTPQAVTVTGQDDVLTDGDQTYNVTATTSSADASWQGLSVADVAVTNNDDDTAGVNVSPVSGLVTTEAGGTASFDVVLNAQPTADVSIDFSTGDTSEGLVSADGLTQEPAVTLTFTGANWNTVQTVTVHGQDDAVNDGDQGYGVVSSTVDSSDGSWNGVAVADVAITNTDDDVSSVDVTPISDLITNEGGATDTFTIVLTSEPTADVTIGLSSSDTGEGTVSPLSLTFTSANWNLAQTVTVTGVDDELADADQTYTIVTADAVSSDPSYNGLGVSDVTVTNRDDETSANDGDGDGIDDVIEDAGPNGGDGNGDGIPDSTQPDVASFPGADTNGSYITLMSTCQLRDVRAVAREALDPTPLELPYGLVEFRLPCTSTDMTVLYHAGDSWAEDTSYWKFGPTKPGDPSTTSWYRFAGANFDIVTVLGTDVARARFTLSDGTYGDDTGTDGQIVDAGGPGTGSPVFAVPTLSQWMRLLLVLLLAAMGFALMRSQPARFGRCT